MSTKIQINSLAALERLIGNDNELEMEIRQSVVTDFTKKHLKGFADTVIQNTKGAILTQVNDHIKQQLNLHFPQRFYDKSPQLGAKLKEEISLAVESFIQETIRESIKKALSGEQIESFVQSYVDRVVQAKIKGEVNQQVSKRLD
jgi:hypothetical protein